MVEKIESTSDERVRNEYRILSDEEKQQVRTIKEQGRDLIETCINLGKSRELSLAITKVEEAVMWAVKHVTR